MGFVLGITGFLLAAIGIGRGAIRVSRGESRNFQNKAKAEYEKQRREKGWDDNNGPGEAEFILEYTDKKRPSFLTSFGFIMIGLLMLISSCAVPA